MLNLIAQYFAWYVENISVERKSSLGMSGFTVSTGAAEHKIGLTKEELIKRVQGALSDAKKKGKNRVAAFKQ